MNLRRKTGAPIGLGEMRGVIAEYSAWQVIINTPRSVLEALEIEERFRISFWDALIVQAAAIAGAKVLYTEDLSHGQAYGSVLAVNPFVVA